MPRLINAPGRGNEKIWAELENWSKFLRTRKVGPAAPHPELTFRARFAGKTYPLRFSNRTLSGRRGKRAYLHEISAAPKRGSVLSHCISSALCVGRISKARRLAELVCDSRQTRPEPLRGSFCDLRPSLHMRELSMNVSAQTTISARLFEQAGIGPPQAFASPPAIVVVCRCFCFSQSCYSFCGKRSSDHLGLNSKSLSSHGLAPRRAHLRVSR